MTHTATYFHPDGLRVFALFTGITFVAGMLGMYLIRFLPATRFSDGIKFGFPILGFAAAILISHRLHWLTVKGAAMQYLKAAVVAGIAMPATFAVYFLLATVTVMALGALIPSMTDQHPAYIATAYLTAATAGSVFPLLIGYALLTLTGVWDWRLLGAICAVMWLGLLTPSPWDRPFVAIVGGLIGLWLSRPPAAGAGSATL
jgi:hypothetical protein